MIENKIIDEKLESIYKKALERPLKIYEIFKDFFGEDKVDYQYTHNIDKFKMWFHLTVINKYLISYDVPLNDNEWYLVKDKSLYEIPEKLALKLIDCFEHRDILQSITRENTLNTNIILVHFPIIKVTNENNKYVYIKDVFIKIVIDDKGRIVGTFTINRSRYQEDQFKNGYMHSHVKSIDYNNLSIFKNPCLGRGPINSTIATLAIDQKDDYEDLWRMFCLELTKYLETESLAGIPYKYLEQIGRNSNTSMISTSFKTVVLKSYIVSGFLPEDIKDFTKYFIESKQLRFRFHNGSFCPATSFKEFIVMITNTFIEWFNHKYNTKTLETKNIDLERLLELGTLEYYIIQGNNIFKNTISSNYVDINRYIGKPVCTFKDKVVKLEIDKDELIDKSNETLLLNFSLALYILDKIIKILNIRYGREKTTETESTDPEFIFI